jgi:hypothetical protein
MLTANPKEQVSANCERCKSVVTVEKNERLVVKYGQTTQRD